MKPIVSVIIPVYNETNRIANTLITIQKIEEIDFIYVIDDGSTDGTAEVVNSIEGIHLIKHPINLGKGTALLTGVKEVISKSDIIVFLDGDLEESSKEVNKLINPILENTADVTIGKFPPAKKKGGFGLVKKLVKLGLLIHTGQVVASALSGQRAFKKEVLQQIGIKDKGYGIELAMTIDILRNRFKIVEVDVEMYHNETGRTWHGFRHRGRQFYHILKVIIRKTFEKS